MDKEILNISLADRYKLMRQVQNDSAVLSKFMLLDYSLLVAIEKVKTKVTPTPKQTLMDIINEFEEQLATLSLEEEQDFDNFDFKSAYQFRSSTAYG